jgi:hypothetical protein
MFPRQSFLINCVLVICWAYLALYVFPSATFTNIIADCSFTGLLCGDARKPS